MQQLYHTHYKYPEMIDKTKSLHFKSTDNSSKIALIANVVCYKKTDVT